MAEKFVVPEADAAGRFGEFGGRFVPETLMAPVEELTRAYTKARADASFRRELHGLLTTYAGRPTPLTEARRLSAELGARIFLKREDLLHTGAHKINNALGQVLLAKRMGKSRVIAETGAGQHGVATATAAALMGLPCVVYMGSVDIERQALNVYRMRLLGTKVVSVESGSKTLKDAINEAMRDWVANYGDTHYVLGSVLGPHPYPRMVRDFHAVIGRETRTQARKVLGGKLPDLLVACVGGGSNAMGIFAAFVPDREVALIGVEATGEGVASGRHAATMAAGEVGVYHGMRSLVLQTADGQLQEAHSISAGLDYPGVGPEHAHLRATGRARYIGVSDQEALAATALLARRASASAPKRSSGLA